MLERILGIDYGTTRIGIAISDPLGIIARPVATITNSAKIFTELAALIKQYMVEKIVIGNPLTMSGEQKASSEKVQAFITELKTVFTGEIIIVDERLTSVQAHGVLRETKSKKQRRDKSLVDTLAAEFILQSYLDRRAFMHRNTEEIPG